MANKTAQEILQIMAKGVDPITGEILPDDHLCHYPEVVRALCLAVQSLSTNPTPNDLTISKKNGKLNAGRPWSNVDLFELQRMYQSGASMDDICKTLQRRERGILKQLAHLGLIENEKESSKKSAHFPAWPVLRWL